VKSEIRNPKSEGNPKAEIRKGQALMLEWGILANSCWPDMELRTSLHW
jgi:hypothetical protein